MLRRGFLAFTGKLALVFSALGMGVYSLSRALVPDVLYEPSPETSVGKPDIFPEGVTFISSKRLFIVREGNEFYSISAICAHLGCTVNYVPLVKEKEVSVKGKALKEIWEFSCPCHGSKYYADGTNYAGPAPRPLARFAMDISPVTGDLVVNTAKAVDGTVRLKV